MICDFELGDEAWQKEREKRWKTIKRKLRDQDSKFSSRALIDTLGRYYLSGVHMNYIPLVFQMGFHPTSTAGDWTLMCAEHRASVVEEAKVYSANPAWREEDPLFGEKADALRSFFYPEEPRTIVAKDGEVLAWFYQRYGFEQWWGSIETWLSHPPPGMWPVAVDTVDWMWTQIPPSIDEPGLLWALRYAMIQCANFVPPIGLRGDDIPQKRFAARLRNELDSHDLPPHFQKLWDTMKTRAGRSKLWDRDLLRDGETNQYRIIEGLENLALFGVPATLATMCGVQETLLELGFTESKALGAVQPVELEGHVTDGFAQQLGYEKGEPLGAWRVRVKTTPDYVDSEAARINLDMLALQPKRPIAKDVPTLLIVHRPLEAYAQIGAALTYTLNVKLFRRAYEASTGHVLKTYGPKDGWTVAQAKREFPPFFKAKFQALKVGSDPLVDDDAHDFPPWEGPALPSLPEN